MPLHIVSPVSFVPTRHVLESFLVLFVSTFKEENYKPADFVVSSGRAP